MSDHDECGEDSSAGAAAAPAPTAGDGQESEQHALEKELSELKADIEQLKRDISTDRATVNLLGDSGERLELRRAITEDKKRLQGLEQDMRDLRKKIEQLLAPAEQPTAAGGCSPTSCLPLRSHIGLLASQGIARAPLATGI